MDFIDIAPFAWPLVVALVLLYLLRRVSDRVDPIVINVVNGIASQAQSNALTYGLMIGYGLSASLNALADQATLLKWFVVAAAAKVMAPFVTAMLAFAAKSDLTGKAVPPKPEPTT